MPQNRETGRAAVAFARESFKRVAECLGAEVLPGASNNAKWNGKRINVKSARLGNTQTGATLNNLAWADSIIAAIQENNEYFGLYEVTSDWFRDQMHPSRQPYTMMVECAAIRSSGTRIRFMSARAEEA